MASRNLRRRRFLQAGATAAAAAATASCGADRSPWRCLTSAEARTLQAVCERIVPADQDPGAGALGVVSFIDRQLCGFHRGFRDAYRSGLAAIDETASAMHGEDFASLPAERQTEVLHAIESGKPKGAAWKTLAPRPFFDMLVAHTMQGFYGSPRHGGNRDGASWRMLGLATPPLRGRDQYDFTKRG